MTTIKRWIPNLSFDLWLALILMVYAAIQVIVVSFVEGAFYMVLSYIALAMDSINRARAEARESSAKLSEQNMAILRALRENN